ncbi:hypothetical protein C8J56DRAFT_958454 [Mycena floridula]|nr:hypothetical protein C8J56DRAFT_958454 [Mycena floridula]
MGGDHKCPVCEATFTRPQHVARHMRSHTGDRPYKCQHCGDQFARSDLLSRHVNKCHAGAAPPSGANARRKGSATRATTSKQACDQCVQGSLPCDGGVPCAKCTQRKVRCTFVKFHRQTAPVGPGHSTVPPSVKGSGYRGSSEYGSYAGSSSTYSGLRSASASSTAYPASSTYSSDNQPSGDFAAGSSFGPLNTGYGFDSMLAPASSSNTFSSPSSNTFASPSSTFNSSQFSMPYNVTPTPVFSMNESTGTQERERFQFGAHLSGSPHLSGATPSPQFSASASFPATFEFTAKHRAQDDSARRESPNPYHSSQSSSASWTFDRPYSSSRDARDDGARRPVSQHGTQFSSAFGLMSLDDPAVIAGLANDGTPFFAHHWDGDDGESSTGQSQSQNQNQRQSQATGRFGTYEDPYDRGGSDGEMRDGGNSSFARPPMIQRPSTGDSRRGGAFPGAAEREAETRELREFWSQYLRTPSSGPFGGVFEGSSPHPRAAASPTSHHVPTTSSSSTTNNPTINNSSAAHIRTQTIVNLGLQTPLTEYPKRQRTNSLPTPGTESANPFRAGGINPIRAGGALDSRTLHNVDDLRSYEAAVLARKPVTTLRIPNKKAPAPVQASPTTFSAPAFASPTFSSGFPYVATSRPGSAGASSSLAGAFGYDSPVSSTGYSRKSSLSGDGDEASGRMSDVDSATESRHAESEMTSGLEARPSFKRLASQVLVPEGAATKRKVSNAGDAAR